MSDDKPTQDLLEEIERLRDGGAGVMKKLATVTESLGAATRFLSADPGQEASSIQSVGPEQPETADPPADRAPSIE